MDEGGTRGVGRPPLSFSEHLRRGTLRGRHGPQPYAAYWPYLSYGLTVLTLLPSPRHQATVARWEADPTRLRSVWRSARESFMRDWLETRSGLRPHAWWLCESGGRLRRRLGGVGEPDPEDRRLSYGVRAYWGDIDEHNPPVYESVAEFLWRHELLWPGEYELLEASDFAPEKIEYDGA